LPREGKKEVHRDEINQSRGERCLVIPGFPNFCGTKPQKRPPPPPLKPYEYGPGYPTYYSSGYENANASQFDDVNVTPKTSDTSRFENKEETKEAKTSLVQINHQNSKEVEAKLDGEVTATKESTFTAYKTTPIEINIAPTEGRNLANKESQETSLPSVITLNKPLEDASKTSVHITTKVSNESASRLNTGTISVNNLAKEDVLTPKLGNQSAQGTTPGSEKTTALTISKDIQEKTSKSTTTIRNQPGQETGEKPEIKLTKQDVSTSTKTINPENKSASKDISTFVETTQKLTNKSSQETVPFVETRKLNLESKTSPESSLLTVQPGSFSSIQQELAYKTRQPVYSPSPYPYERSVNYNLDPFQPSPSFYPANHQFLKSSPFAYRPRNYYSGASSFNSYYQNSPFVRLRRFANRNVNQTKTVLERSEKAVKRLRRSPQFYQYHNPGSRVTNCDYQGCSTPIYGQAQAQVPVVPTSLPTPFTGWPFHLFTLPSRYNNPLQHYNPYYSANQWFPYYPFAS